LSLATDNFSEPKKLGSGSFGVVYKGHLADLGSVAVKKIGRVTEQAVSDYSREINTVSRLRHRNLVRLMGSCNERGELLLVYELIGNRSLDDHLHRPNASGDGTPIILSWSRRYFR
jgi:interleukin-1 receptor-associated kinase 1